MVARTIAPFTPLFPSAKVPDFLSTSLEAAQEDLLQTCLGIAQFRETLVITNCGPLNPQDTGLIELVTRSVDYPKISGYCGICKEIVTCLGIFKFAEDNLSYLTFFKWYI